MLQPATPDAVCCLPIQLPGISEQTLYLLDPRLLSMGSSLNTLSVLRESVGLKMWLVKGCGTSKSERFCCSCRSALVYM